MSRAGLRPGVERAMIGTTVAEFLTAAAGLGASSVRDGKPFDTALMIALRRRRNPGHRT